VQAATIATIEKLQIDGAGDLLFAVVAGNDWAGPVRSQALVTLSRFKHWRLPEAVRVAERSSSATLRVAAIPFSSKAAPAAIASLIAKLEGDGDVPGKKAALETLGLMRQREADVAIAAQLRRLQRGEVEPEVQLELVEAAEKRSDDTVGKLLGEFKTRAEKDADPLAPFLVALRGGDAERGRKIFREHPVAACIRCHQVDGEGGAAGPNLSDVAARHPREYLLESVVRPNAKIAAGFQGVLLTLADGGVQAGAVTAEDSGTLTLRRADNSVVRIVKSEIAKQESAPSSMPDIFGQVLTRAELRDVVEYLASLRAASAQQAIAHGAGTEAFRTDPRGLQAGLTDE
jgi:quinoprotein glucose dehydrogenase